MPEEEKILLVSYYFPPINTAGVYRILGFTRYLPENGIRPILLTGSERVKRENRDESLAKNIPKKLIIERIGSWCLPTSTRKGIAGKIVSKIVSVLDTIIPIDPFFFFSIGGTLAACKIIKRFQCRAIVTSSPPHSIHIIGYFIRRFMKIAWLADFRDPIKPRVIHRSFIERYLLGKAFFLRILEKLVVMNANIIIANTPTNKKELEEKYPESRGKIVVIPNGFDSSDEEFDSIVPEESKPDRLTISYAGEIYEGMGDMLWEGIRMLSDEDPMLSDKFEIIIAGLVTDSDLKKIENNKILNIVKYVGFLKHIECQRLISRSNIALLLLPPGNFSYWIPSKVYNYFSMRKFVLGIIPQGDASRLIQEIKAGIFVPPEPARIAGAIKELIDAHARGDLKTEYDEDRLKRYTRSYQTLQLSNAIRAAVRNAADETKITA